MRKSLFTIPDKLSKSMRMQRRHMLARMALAWLIMMQVMMLAFPGYLRGNYRAPESQHFLDQAIFLMNWSSLVLCVPLMLYCAWPIWHGAVRDLRRWRIGMDVPVAISIIVSFIPSVIATLHDYGEVYFDSVSMFVAFLLTAKYLELSARQAFADQTVQKYDDQLLRSADRLAFWFVCIQILLAAVVGLYWWLHAPEHTLAIVVALLVISCPCAMSMSVPSAIAARQFQLLNNPSLLGNDYLNLRMQRIAKQNLYGSLAWHILMTPLAAIGLVQPWLAAISMLISSLLVAANSWRLTRQDLTKEPDLVINPG